MADNSEHPVDANGVPQDNSPYAVDDESPLNSAGNGPAASGLGGARAAAESRYSTENSRLTRLQAEADRLGGVESDAYAKQKQILEDATNRLLSTPVGPTDQEAAYRLAASYGAKPGNGVNVSGWNQENANILKERREAELNKQMLIAQYQGQVPASIIGQVGAQLNQNLGQQRVASQQVNNAGGEQFKGYANDPWYVKRDQNGHPFIPPQAVSAMNTAEMSKLYGKFLLKPRMDGGKDIVLGAGLASQAGAPQAPQAPQAPGQAPQLPARTPTMRSPQVGGAAQPQVPNAGSSPSHYDDMFMPSTILDSRYGSLTPATKPAYVKTAQQAFDDPNYFKNYTFTPHTFRDPQIYQKNVETMGQELRTSAQASDQMLYNYGNALATIDGFGNDKKLLTGPIGEKIGAFENTLRGISPALAQSLTNDPQLASLAAKQESDKYFRQAALTGLKAIFAGRITNQEMQQRMASLPSANLMPAVTRMLAAAQAEQAQDMINKSKVFGEYVRRGGDPMNYDTFYQANFSPFVTSRLRANLAASRQPVKPQPQISPEDQKLIDHYIQLGKANQPAATT